MKQNFLLFFQIFAASCYNAISIPLDEHLKQVILNMHNKGRSEIAEGNVSNFPSAARMRTLQWDDELALVAKLNTLKCRTEHDRCHNTFRYPRSGQNIGLASIENMPLESEVTKVITDLIQNWFNEWMAVMPSDIVAIKIGVRKIGHFTMMINDKQTHIGCALSRFTGNRCLNFLFTCNYSSNNVIGRRIYKLGRPTSECINGPNQWFRGLCRDDEPF